MNSKQNRIQLISKIIESETVRSQQDIIDRLNEAGINITQASLSRYLKEIQASRVPDGKGSYIYQLPTQSSLSTNNSILSELKSVEFAGDHIVVIHTMGGYANAVSAQIDALKLPSIVGTVSGDDTIIMIIRDGYTTKDVRTQLIKEFSYIKDKILNG